MYIYDFDNTIYEGDTSKDILIYSLKKHPILVLKSLKEAKKLEKEYKAGKVEFERVKETLFSFLFKIENLDDYLNEFVEKHFKKIKSFYIHQMRDEDLVISASYELWVNKFCKKLGIRYVIATKTNKDGYIEGKNCKGVEKLKRLASTIPNARILESYSDSSSDIPILEVAIKPFVVEGEKVIPYVKGYNFKNND